MVGEYCASEEMQKLEQELCNLTMQEDDVATYTICFTDLATLCTRMVTLEDQKIEMYI